MAYTDSGFNKAHVLLPLSLGFFTSRLSEETITLEQTGLKDQNEICYFI